MEELLHKWKCDVVFSYTNVLLRLDKCAGTGLWVLVGTVTVDRVFATCWKIAYLNIRMKFLFLNIILNSIELKYGETAKSAALEIYFFTHVCPLLSAVGTYRCSRVPAS